MISLVIWSTPLATSFVPISSDSAFAFPSTPLLIGSEGMSSVPAYLPIFTAASTSPSVLADCPHFHWRSGWFVVWSRRCLVHRCTCHLSILPTSPALHICLWSAYSLYHRWQLLSASWFWEIMLLCRRPLYCFLLSFLSPWHHTAPLSHSVLVDLIFFLISLCTCWYCSLLRHLGVSAHSVVVSRHIHCRSKISFIIQIWILSISSPVHIQQLPVALIWCRLR